MRLGAAPNGGSPVLRTATVAYELPADAEVALENEHYRIAVSRRTGALCGIVNRGTLTPNTPPHLQRPILGLAVREPGATAQRVIPPEEIAFEGAEARREAMVLHTEDGSPAHGALQKEDFVIGANGRLFQDGQDPRIALGFALVEAQGELGGVLTLQVVRGGEPLKVPVPLGETGGYSPTWPFACPKSKAIADKAVRLILDRARPEGVTHALRHGGGSWWNPLFLMASGDDEALERARRDVYSLLGREPTTHTWNAGYHLTILAEYYLLTGDSVVLPAIEAQKDKTEWGMARSGSWGHGMPCGGYGEVNATGLTCLISLVLAEQCGMGMDPVKYPLSVRFFKKFAGGGIPYGNHPGGPFGRSDNGRNGMAAVVFHCLGDDATARAFARPICYSYRCRELGHAEGIFAFNWGPLGAFYAPRPELHMFLSQMLWYHELGRLRNGGLHFLRVGHFPSPFGHTGAMGLHLMLPRRKLQITGAPRSVFGQKPPSSLKAYADLYREKKWEQLKSAIAGYKKSRRHLPSNLAYVDGLLAAYQRLEKHAEATMAMVRENVKADALKAQVQLEALGKLLGEERPEMATIRQHLESPEGQAAIEESRRRHKARPDANDTPRLQPAYGPGAPIVWDDVLPLAAETTTPYHWCKATGADPPAADAVAWRQQAGPLKAGGPCWVRRTFTLDHGRYSYLELLTNNAGETWLNGYRLAIAPAHRGRGKQTRALALRDGAAAVLREGTNELTARLEGKPIDVALRAGPRKPDLAALRKGLVAYWRLDEGKGSTVRCQVSGQASQVRGGDAKWVEGKMGSALNLGGKAVVEAQGFKDPETRPGKIEAMTVALWARMGRHEGDIVRKMPGGRAKVGWRLSLGRFEAALADGGALRQSTPGLGAEWAHCVVVFDAKAKRFAAYADAGAERNRQVLKREAKIGTTPIEPSLAPLLIGEGGRSLKIVDELAIWRRALCEEEVKALCNGGRGLSLVGKEVRR